MKGSYLAITVAEDNKYFAYRLHVSHGDNLVSSLRIKGILHANICATKKVADEIVLAWNNSYKQNGTYLYN